jgi:putative nucleotidyltransferase with HDIG domain
MVSHKRIASRLVHEGFLFKHPTARRLVRASLIGSSATGATIVAMSFVEGAAKVPVALVAGVCGGMLGSLAARVFRPFGEGLFGVTTTGRLLELANPAHPLMRMLMTNAPGTYTHSVVTANLAENAAEAIGVNPLVARVGGYYHDIGKLVRPEFFFENLAGGQNPHDEATPDMSTRIIVGHVRDGLELAEAYSLPKEIEDIICEHHGTSVVKCFYRKAAEADASVFESAFRYPEAKPHTREAAVVMLADGCEAAVRAVRSSSTEQIGATVRSVVAEREEDGQLEESGLRPGDIDTIVGCYTRILASMYHPRMAYPDSPPRRDVRADIHHEPQRARTA